MVYGLIRLGDCPSLGKDFDISMAFMPPGGFSFFAVYIAGTVPKPGNPLNGYINDMAEQATKISSEFEKSDSVKNIPYYIGQMALENIPKELRPILTVGSFCHIGKGATQGYGGYFLR